MSVRINILSFFVDNSLLASNQAPSERDLFLLHGIRLVASFIYQMYI